MNNDVITILLPNIISLVFSRICPMERNLIPKTKSQPAGWFFGVAWPVLYLLIGINWVLHKNNKTLNALHWILIFSLNLWLYFAGCENNYQKGGWTFILITAVSLSVWMMSSLKSKDWYGPLLLTPLLAWILFAHQLNVHIVEKQS